MSCHMSNTSVSKSLSQGSTFTPRLVANRACIPSARPSRNRSILVRAENVLIVNTKGGGHAFIGLHLAEQLLANRHTVTVLNDGDEEKLSKKPPFNQYSKVKGLTVVYGDPTNPRNFPAGGFDVVYDNNGKDLETCKPLIDAYKKGVKHYVFVASAGAYNPNPIEPIHMEGDPRKSSAGHVAVEKYLEEANVPYTVFQPLYIYGPHTAKDCEQWFLDRIMRDRPVPLPKPGVQLVTLSHVEDVASMLAAVPGKEEAKRQQYNVCSDRAISFNGIVKALAQAAGKTPEIVYYDTDKVGLKKGEGFPFRTGHFFASAEKAKRELGWTPKHDFLNDAPELVRAYAESGRLSKDIDFSVDDKILEAVGYKVPALA